MSVITFKRVGLATVAVVSVGGIIKASVDASSPSVVPLADASELSFAPPKQLNSDLNTSSENNQLLDSSQQKKSRHRRNTEQKVQIQTHFSESRPFQVDKTVSELLQSKEEEYRKVQKVNAFLSKLGIYPEDIRDELAKKGPEGIRKSWREAEKIYKKLDDYSFKLFGPCVYGTAWILDYQLPDSPEKYPTTWYIATNAHVIQNFRFGSNPYGQILPKNLKDTESLRAIPREGLIARHKEAPLDHERCSNHRFAERYGYLDINIARGEEGVQRKGDYGAIGLEEMEEPNLFFGAIDFLGEDQLAKLHKSSEYGYYADFAVLELKFKNEEYAKRTTNNFAGKYGVNSTDAINIFGDPAETQEGKVPKQWEGENVYLLAYPSGVGERKNGNKWLPTKNFDERSGIASRLRELTENRKMSGYDTLWWGGKGYKEFGHGYETRHNPLGGGSSGGLVVDKHLNALSLNTASTAGFVGASWSLSTPLRSNGVKFRYGLKTIVTPKFDLILGVDGQKGSYKKQVEEHIIKKGKRTWLSARNWRHRTHDDQSWILIDSYSDF